MQPFEITPALTTERLQVLAHTVVRVRRDALGVYQPEKGDNAWSFGCVCYVRECAAFKALEIECPWLRVESDGLACTLLVDGEPIKFYRGDPERPSDRSLRGGVAQAILQGKLAFLEDELAKETDGWFWLMAIVADDVENDASIAVLQANRNGETREPWFVPLDNVAVLTTVKPAQDGVDLPPPSVEPRRIKSDVEDDGPPDDEP